MIRSHVSKQLQTTTGAHRQTKPRTFGHHSPQGGIRITQQHEPQQQGNISNMDGSNQKVCRAYNGKQEFIVSNPQVFLVATRTQQTTEHRVKVQEFCLCCIKDK